jgi:hypothetical protein
MELDRERVQKNAQLASTEYLLDRVTAYRPGMEPEALVVFEAELRRRGVGQLEIEEHAFQRSCEVITHPDGTAVRCSFCERPAVARRWGWHRLWGLVHLFPRRLAYCDQHQPTGSRKRK